MLKALTGQFIIVYFLVLVCDHMVFNTSAACSVTVGDQSSQNVLQLMKPSHQQSAAINRIQ